MKLLRFASALAVICLCSSSYAAEKAKTAKESDQLTKDEMVQSCVTNREKSFECKDEFIDAMVTMRAKHDPEMAKKIATPEGKAEAVKTGIEEITADGSGDLEPRKQKCAEMADKMIADKHPMTKADQKKMDACYTKADCKQKMACIVGIFDAHMPKAAPAPKK